MIRLRKWLRRRAVARRNPRGLLHSVEQMRALLERERMRSDRGRSTFALLTLTFAPRDGAALRELVRVLGRRLRATDDAGFLGSRRIGVVLPETPAAGAWKLAEDLCAMLPDGLPRPHCDVYLHAPHDDSSEPRDDQGDGQRRHDDREVSVPSRGRRRQTQEMQVLFAQPLPAWKRALDVVGASTALLLASPVMLGVAAAIKLTSPGPVFFRQRRHTLAGRPFTIFKFRTMCVDAERQKAALRKHSEQDGPAFKMTNDPRVTRLGRFLRTTSIDELPQLFNVLLGDMSLVGPRPLPCDESSRCEPWQRRRLDVTPGLTCIWQVRGRSAVSFADWIRMDIRYIESRSLVNDVKLIAQTVPAVVMRRGAC